MFREAEKQFLTSLESEPMVTSVLELGKVTCNQYTMQLTPAAAIMAVSQGVCYAVCLYMPSFCYAAEHVLVAGFQLLLFHRVQIFCLACSSCVVSHPWQMPFCCLQVSAHVEYQGQY